MMLSALRQYGLVYLATPYTKYPGGIDQAYADACVLVGRLIQEGIGAFSPICHGHGASVHGGVEPLDHDLWLEFDSKFMRACDALLVAKLISWEMSFGIMAEIEEFAAAGKPIYFLEPKSMVVTKT